MQTFSPFPLRARGLVEQFDASIQLYKQYFWVLLAWSAINTVGSTLGSLVAYGFGGFPFIPLNVGAVVCCVAAAVRGQSANFGQCWRFTQPRYWPMLALQLLGGIIAVVIISILAAGGTGLVFGGLWLFGQSNGTVQVVAGILGGIVLGTIFLVLLTIVFAWLQLVLVVVCMEDDKRGVNALGRAFDILKGHWLRIVTLLTLVGLAVLSLYAILGGTMALLIGVSGIKDMLNGQGSVTTTWLSVLGLLSLTSLTTLLYKPFASLLFVIFYLDVRVRQEALDLEWTAHTTAPEMPVESIAPSTPLLVHQDAGQQTWNAPSPENIAGTPPGGVQPFTPAVENVAPLSHAVEAEPTVTAAPFDPFAPSAIHSGGAHLGSPPSPTPPALENSIEAEPRIAPADDATQVFPLPAETPKPPQW